MTDTDDLAPQALPSGPDGILIRFALTPSPRAMAAAQSLAADLDATPPAGVTQIVTGLVSVLLRFDRDRTGRGTLVDAALARAQAIAQSAPAPPPARRVWTIPASFGGSDGPQLSEVASLTGQSVEDGIGAVCAAELRVLTIGFAPGQPYLGLLPPAWDLPRMNALTAQVPAGAIVVALRQIVMFGAASPTGWRQIGRSAFRSFRPDRDPPMPLRTGDAVRFRPVSPAELADLERAPEGWGGATMREQG